MLDLASWRCRKALLRRQQGTLGVSGKAGFPAEGPEEGAGLVCLRNSQETSEAGARGEDEGGRSREILLAH